MKIKLKEPLVKRLREIRGNKVGYRVDRIRLPNGKTAVREYLTHPGAVAVIALLGKNRIVMVRQYRHPVRRVTLEIPAGKLDKKEKPLDCVKRELKEETGFTAGRIRKLLSFWPTAAFADEIIHIYVATGLKPGKTNPDDDEFLRCEIWPVKKVFQAIKKGRIKDAKTLIALLAYQRFSA